MKKILGLLFFAATAAFGQSNFADPMQNQAVRLDGGDVSLSGTVTSVNIAGPPEFGISGAPILSFGTITLSWSANSTPDLHYTLIGNGTQWIKKIVNDCTGAGKALTFIQASDSFGCNTIAGGGAVATDPIWDAAGDLVYGTGADTAVRLAPSTATTLLHSGTTPSWSAVSLTADVTGLLPFANIANGSALSLFGRSANSAGVQASIAATAASDCIFREQSSVVGCGTIASAGIGAGAVTYAKLQNTAALAVIGNATNSSAVNTAIAATAGSDQFLQETGSTLAWVNPWLDPQTVWMYSDFFAIGSQQQTPFSNLVSGAGAASSRISATGLANHPGVVSVETGTTTTGYSEYFAGNVDAHEALFLASGTPFTFEAAVRVTTLSDGTDTYSLRAGLFDNGAGAAVDGVFFSYVQASDTHWRMNTCNASTCTATNTTTTVNAAQWYALKIVCNSAMTSCAFYIDGVQDAASPLTTNIPINRDTGLYAINILKSAGTTNRVAWIDYCKFFMRLSTAR